MTDYRALARATRDEYDREHPSTPVPFAELQPGYRVAHVDGPQGRPYITVRTIERTEIDYSRPSSPLGKVIYTDGFVSAIPPDFTVSVLDTSVTRRVYYTADLVIPDDSDTDHTGQPCEPGHGYRVESGWYDPDASRTTVHDEQDDVRPDIYDPDDATPAEWLTERLTRRLGTVEASDYRSIYAVDAHDHDGVSVRMAAHPKGFTDAEVDAALNAL
jgi:hypothetical protein